MGFYHKHLAGCAEDFDFSVAFRCVLVGFIELKSYLAVRTLHFDLRDLLLDDPGGLFHLARACAAMRALFLLLLPRPHAQLAVKFVALMALDGILHNMLINKAFKILIYRRSTL